MSVRCNGYEVAKDMLLQTIFIKKPMSGLQLVPSPPVKEFSWPEDGTMVECIEKAEAWCKAN